MRLNSTTTGQIGIAIFMTALLILAYMQIQNERYDTWASCMEWVDNHDSINPNWYDICSGALTHKLQNDVAPAEWIN